MGRSSIYLVEVGFNNLERTNIIVNTKNGRKLLPKNEEISRLRKTSMIVKIYQISFHVSVCAFPPQISSFFDKSYPFFFVLSVLWYFPFHVINIMELMLLSHLLHIVLVDNDLMIILLVLNNMTPNSNFQLKFGSRDLTPKNPTLFVFPYEE